MHLNPCSRHCHLTAECTHKASILRVIRAKRLGITCANVKCSRMFDGLPVGTRVSVTLELLFRKPGRGCIYTLDPPEDILDWTDTIFRGTVTRHLGYRCMVWLDEPIEDDLKDISRTRIKVQPGRLTPLDEPPVFVCPICHRPENRKNDADWIENCELCGNHVIKERSEP